MSQRIIDATVPLSSRVPTFPGDPPFKLELVHRMDEGKPYNVGLMTLGSHAGTHIDAPFHFIADGATVDQLPLEILMGRARVIEVHTRDRIGVEHLKHLDLSDDLRVLFKTRMSGQLLQPEFQEDFVYLTPEAAAHLVQCGIKLVGIDYLSVEKFGSHEFPAHLALLEAGVVIVEGLDLSEAEAGEYDFTCLPLRIAGGDGAPARALLRKRS